MKKINKISLSGVEYLSEQEAQMYVADSHGSEIIVDRLHASSRSGTDSGNSGDSGDSGNSGSAGSGDSGLKNVTVMAECEGVGEGGACVTQGKKGTCEFRKVEYNVFPVNGHKVALMCVGRDIASSGEVLTEREYACVGKSHGDPCTISSISGTSTQYRCYYNKFSLGPGILTCRQADYK